MSDNRNARTRVTMSYGIILFTVVTGILPGVPKFLLYQRRDNYEYIDFLRGNYKTDVRLRELLSVLSEEEKLRIRRYTFKELWDDLWVIHDSRIHNEGYDKALRKYESIKSKIPDILDSIPKPLKDHEPAWGFPKGKKLNSAESDVECALREFTEETKLPQDEVVVIKDQRPYVEKYKGNNDRLYSTVYFLAEADREIPIQKIQTPQCIRSTTVSEEAADLKWLTIEQIADKLNPDRRQILKRALMDIYARMGSKNY